MIYDAYESKMNDLLQPAVLYLDPRSLNIFLLTQGIRYEKSRLSISLSWKRSQSSHVSGGSEISVFNDSSVEIFGLRHNLAFKIS